VTSFKFMFTLPAGLSD